MGASRSRGPPLPSTSRKMGTLALYLLETEFYRQAG